MNTPYLIQRGKFADNSDCKTGIDAIVQWDYMGAAEFEFGALPASLKRMRASINDYHLFTHRFKNANMKDGVDKVVSVFAPASATAEVSAYLKLLGNDKIHCKESVDLRAWVCPSQMDKEWGRKNKTDFWWDIGNDFMFWKEHMKMDDKVMQALKNGKK